MTSKRGLGDIQVELIRGKDIRPKTEEVFSDFVYITDMDAYQEKKSIFDIAVFDDGTIDLHNGFYYIKDTWTSIIVSNAELDAFHEAYGNEPTRAQKKKLRIAIVLIKFDIMNGIIYVGEGDDYNNKIVISPDMLIDNQI